MNVVIALEQWLQTDRKITTMGVCRFRAGATQGYPRRHAAENDCQVGDCGQPLLPTETAMASRSDVPVISEKPVFVPTTPTLARTPRVAARLHSSDSVIKSGPNLQ